MTLWGSRRFLLLSNAPGMNPSAVVNRNPPPHPCITRNATIMRTFSLRHSPTELPENRAIPISRELRGPSLSMRTPAIMTTVTSAIM